MKLDLKKIKKIAADEHTTTLSTHDGHQVVVAHKNLHPATRGALAALPLVGQGKINAMAEGGSVQQGGPEVARKEKYANGGGVEPQYDQYGRKVAPKVPGGNGSPAIDPNKAQANQDDAEHVTTGSEYKENVKKAWHSMGFAQGGKVDELGPDGEPRMIQIQEDMPKHLVSGSPMPKVGEDRKPASKGPQKFAEGTPDTVIDVAQAPQIPADLLNQAPGAEFAAQQQATQPQPASGAASPTESPADSLPYGVTPEMAGMASKQPDAAASPQMEASATQPKAPASPQQAAGANDPFGTNAYQDSYMSGLKEKEAGLVQAANAAQQQGQAEAKALGEQQAIKATQATEYQTHYKALDTERQSLLNDIQNQHIDPNHFVNTKDGASKIATAIGLIASGMGGAMSGQENLAAKFLHQQIENDISAQKAELGKKENLLSANMRQFGNLRDATDMTRIMQSDVLGLQLQKAAAEARTPQAKAALLQAQGDLHMSTAPVQAQMAMRKTLLSGAAKGQISPESVIRMVVPENQQAGATKELKEAQSMYKLRDNALSAFDQIASINTLGNRLSNPLQSRSQVKKIIGGIVPALSKESAGRYTESDAKAIEDLLVSGVSDDEKSRQIGRNELNKLMTEKLNFPELKKWTIDLSNTGRYDMSGRPRVPESQYKRK